MADHTTLHINCDPAQKYRWLLTARANNMSFEQWVTATLNAAAVDTAWATGLSERTTACLISAGFGSRASVAEALENPDYPWQAISNFGPRCKREIEDWIND